MSNKAMTLLIVEDDDVDFWSIERTLQKLKITNPIKRATDGIDAFEILCRETDAEATSKSAMILLDLNMPRIGGLDFLRRLREDTYLRDIPVMVLTTSERNEDIIEAYKYDILSYVVKNDLADGLREAFDNLDMPKTFVIAA